MKRGSLFFKILTVLLSFALSLGAVSNPDASVEKEIAKVINDENSTLSNEVPYVKVPFSMLLDETNPKIKIKVSKEADLKLNIKNRGDKGYLNIISFKDGKNVEDINITSDFQKEYNFNESDEIFLDSHGKFFIDCFKVEVIADMEFNIPDEAVAEDVTDENVENESFEKFKEVKDEGDLKVAASDLKKDKKDINVTENKESKEIVELSEDNKNVIVETEVVSAEDEEAFLKATGAKESNKSLEETKEDNKIVLLRDKTPDKKEFLAKVKEDIKDSSIVEKKEKVEIETPKISSPKDEFKAPQTKESLALLTPPSLKEDKKLDTPKDDKALDEIKSLDENKLSSAKKDLIARKDISFRKPQDVKSKLDLDIENEKDLSLKNEIKEERSNLLPSPSLEAKAPVIAAPILPSKTPSLKFKEDLKSQKSPSLTPPDIKEESLGIKKPKLSFKEKMRENSLDKLETIDVKESGDLGLKPDIKEKDISFVPPTIEKKSISVKESELGEKPNLKMDTDLRVVKEIPIEKSPKFSSEIDLKKPVIKDETSLPSTPSFEVVETQKADNIKVKKIEPEKREKGNLQIYVLKDDRPIVGWIDIIDVKTNKIVANGDTFNKNPVTFTLPSGKYTIVITDKKVVPPLQEKFYDVEVLPNQTIVKKTKFSQGTLTINVTKNLEPTATAFVRVYDQKTNSKVLDDNTYRNNPVKVKLPQGLYYVEIEDYSIVPKQFKRIKDIKIEEGKEIVKSVNFEEGELLLKTSKNDQPVGIRYEIYKNGERTKIKSGYTNENGEAALKLAAGLYDIRAVNKSTVLKSIKIFKGVKISPQTLTELNIEFKEGKLKVFSERGMNPLYTNVSIYKPGDRKRLYFDFTSRSDGVVVMKLPVGVYDVVVRDHNIKRVFKRIRIRPNLTTNIHARF